MLGLFSKRPHPAMGLHLQIPEHHPALGWDTKTTNGGICHMKDLLTKLTVKWELLKDENGQDLIEYGLLVALVAFAATAGMTSLATDINKAFTQIGTTLSSYTA
jgi:pilus assembly protein Flp/PilA